MQYALFYIDFFVNNIQKNHHLTALNGDFIIVCVTFLIMPFIGLSPFLRRTGKYYVNGEETLCQCPLSGFLHFYKNFTSRAGVEMLLCQCPLSGFLHFYGKIAGRRRYPNTVCQCPLSGFLHFYQNRCSS